MKIIEVVDSEHDYIPKETRKMFKLGEYAEKTTLLQYRSYYVYDPKQEAILVEDGDDQAAAYDLYRDVAKSLEYEDKWALLFASPRRLFFAIKRLTTVGKYDTMM